MVKDISAPLARTARLLDLVPFLTSHQGIAIKELAAEFDVTPAQISADLTTLWMCGLPGYTALELMDLQFESGFVTIRNAETLAKPRRINFEEGLALLMGLDILKSQLPTDRSDLAQSVEELALRISVKVGVPRTLQLTPLVVPAIEITITHAIAINCDVEIEYHSLYSDTLSIRTVQPSHVFQEAGHTYLSTFCLSANAPRTFRLDRVRSAKVINRGILRQLDATEPQKINFEILIHRGTRDLVERFGLTENPPRKKQKLRSFSSQWIIRSIFATADVAQLIDPPDIRAKIAVAAASLLNRYQDRVSGLSN